MYCPNGRYGIQLSQQVQIYAQPLVRTCCNMTPYVTFICDGRLAQQISLSYKYRYCKPLSNFTHC